jgi:hypothetical protein
MRRALPFYMSEPEAWLETMAKIPRDDDKWVLRSLIDLMYILDGPLNQGNEWIAHRLHTTERKIVNCRARLVAGGHLVEATEGLSSKRAMKEILARRQKVQNYRDASPKRLRKIGENNSSFIPVSVENISNCDPDQIEKQEKANKINVTDAQIQDKSRLKPAVESRVEIEDRKKDPLSPQGGTNAPTPLAQEKNLGDGHPDNSPVTERPRFVADISTQALKAYNEAAAKHGWLQAAIPTGKRMADLRDRVIDLGGMDEFRKCLEAATRDDLFMGRIKPRAGQPQFRMNLNTLLGSKGVLGDVIGRLSDQAHAIQAYDWQKPETAAMMLALKPDNWRKAIASGIERGTINGTWPIAKMGPAPGQPGSFIPSEVAAEYGLTNKYDVDGNSNGVH